LQSLADAFFELYIIINPTFAVLISILSLGFRDISISGFGGHFWLSVIIRIAYRYSLRALRDRKSRVCRWNFDDIRRTFGDANTSGLGRPSHIAIPGSCQSRIYLWTLTSSLPWSKTVLLPLEI